MGAIGPARLGDGGGDEIFRTWVHESLHARQPFALPAAELRGLRGYEEGMVEGLARILTREKTGMRTLDASYASYVVAYRAVAAVMSVGLEALWRRLWHSPTGEVRAVFVGTVDQLRHEAVGQVLTPRQRDRLQGLADRAFASSQSLAPAAEPSNLERAFRLVFR